MLSKGFMKSSLISFARSRHLYKRSIKHVFWIMSGNRFTARGNIEENTLPYLWTTFECPVVNHPTQASLLPSKVFNMQLACTKLNGLIIRPNEIFSFWRIIGPPTKENGFLSGPTFERGEIITSYGGGLCQISGLLYNLALYSGLKILERHPHSIDAYGNNRYLPLAQDATVAWISKDLCFQNNTNSELQIFIKANQEKVKGLVHAEYELEHSIHINHSMKEDFFIDGKLYRSAKIVRSISNHLESKSEDFGWNIYKTY